MYAGYTKTFGGLVDVVEFNTVTNIFHHKKEVVKRLRLRM